MIENQEAIETAFERIGARVKFETEDRPRFAQDYRVDIRDGRRQGEETFLITRKRDWNGEVVVTHRDKKRRHLLLMVRTEKEGRPEKHRYLCGHDERAWFVATVPDREGGIHDIDSAMEALKPEGVLKSQESTKLKKRHRNRRRNDAFTRQGEWFFVPVPNAGIDEDVVLRNEPLRRGGGKPHVAEMLVRHGGTRVYVCSKYPNGLTERRYKALLIQDPHLYRLGWRIMVRDPEVYCKGRITHRDHATITLRSWHRVYPNTESRATWTESLAFLD